MGTIANELRLETDRTEPELAGIVVAAGWPDPSREKASPEPRIAAFVWGGKVRPCPTLPFGKWAAAS